jgi:hypothetical protein
MPDKNRIWLLSVYLNPETGEVTLETPSQAKSMNLHELRTVVEHLKSWILDIAVVALKATGWKGKL